MAKRNPIKPKPERKEAPFPTLPIPLADPIFTQLAEKDGERFEIYQEAKPELREVLREVWEWHVNEYRQDILRRYMLAELIKRVKDDHDTNGGRRYGSHAVRKIAHFFSWENVAIYAALRVAQAFTRMQVEELSQRRMKDGRPLTYYHLQVLSEVADPAERQRFLERALEESLTGSDLEVEVHGLRKERKGEEEEHRGRPLATPKTLDAVILQQERLADEFLHRAEKVWEKPEHSLESKVRDLAFEDYTEARAVELKAHADLMQRLAQEAQERAEEALRVYQEVVRVLKLREKQPSKTPGKAEQ